MARLSPYIINPYTINGEACIPFDTYTKHIAELLAALEESECRPACRALGFDGVRLPPCSRCQIIARAKEGASKQAQACAVSPEGEHATR